MSKKRGKSPSANTNNSTKWETNIVNAELLDTNWTYSLAFLAELIPEDSETINYINSGISTGLRKRFTLISKDKINQLIAEYGNPKVKKGKDAPVNFEICEAGKIYLDKKEDLPLSFVARFIKWILLTHKTEDLKQMSEAAKKVDDKSSKPKKGADKAERTKSSGGKKGAQATGKKSPEPPSVKIDSKLRKRGEPDPDIPYIDDEPVDGSSRYFIVPGMVDCRLLEALTEIGCVATSVIKVTRDIHISPEEEDMNPEGTDKLPIATPNDEENIENEYETKLESLKSFWIDLDKVLKTNKHLLNTPVVTLVAKHLMFPIEKENEELRNKCAMDLFNCLAVLKYDLLDLKRQWRNYLDKSKLIFIPEKRILHDDNTPRESIKEDISPLKEDMSSGDATFDKVDMSYYHHLIQDVPIESTSIYLQMSAMLEQVEVTSGDKVANWNLNTPEKQNELHYDMNEIMKTLTENIYLPKNDLAELRSALNIPSDESDTNKNNEYNVPVHGLDSMVSRDHEIDSKILGPNGILNHELKMMMSRFRQFNFQNSARPDEAVSKKREARLQELLKYLSTTGLSNTEINYAVKLFVLENLTLCSVDENGFIIINNEEGIFQNNIHPVWDDPFMILDDVTQEIIREEIKLSRSGTFVEEKEHTSLFLSENSTLTKGENFPDGILKSSRLSSRSQSPDPNRLSRRKSSVHFMVSDLEDKQAMSSKDPVDLLAILKEQDNETFQTISLEYLQNSRKRSFTEWCFEEFYEPHVLLQVIHDAIYKLPYVDIYQQRRVDGQLLVLHNPFHPDSKLNQQSWNIWLHSNVGFRNYLDFVSDKITDWNRDQEALYQASLLSKELDSTEVDKKVPEPAGQAAANDKSKKRNASKSRSRSSSRTSSVDENANKELSLVIPGSLKAQKLEQDRINKAKEEELLKKELKKQSTSPRKSAKDADKEADKSAESKRPNSKGSNKSKLKKTTFEDLDDTTAKEQAIQSDEEPLDVGEYWPFTSYDLGDNLAHFWGNVAHLFPSDGSTIRIFRMMKLMESNSVRLSVITPQSHVFTVHIIDPTYDHDAEIDDYGKVLEQFQQQSNVCCFGATTCTFNDNITIAASNKVYNAGQIKDDSMAINAPKQSDENPHENPSAGDNKDGNEMISSRSTKPKDNLNVAYNAKIFLTSPDGIIVRVGNEFSDSNEDKGRLLIHMSKCLPNSSQSNTVDVGKDTVVETSRYITSDGLVVSVFSNNSLKVLYSDGTIAVSQLTVESSIHVEEDSEESKLEKLAAKESPTLKKKTKQTKVTPLAQSTPTTSTRNEEPKQSINYFRKWTVYLSNGETFETEADLNYLYAPKLPNIPSEVAGEVSTDLTNNEQTIADTIKNSVDFEEKIEKKGQFKGHQMKETLHVSSATDPSSGETLVTRSDGTLLLVSQEAGIFLSEHPDGTRFTKYYTVEKIQNPKTEGGESHKSRITELLLIESKEYPSITIDVTNTKVETRFGSMGSLLSDSTGFHVFKHSDNTEVEFRPDGEVIFTPSNCQLSYLQPDGPCSYVFNATSNIICEMVDNEGTEFIVDVNGDYSINSPHKVHESGVDDGPHDEDGDDLGARDSPIGMSNENVDTIRKYDHHAPRLFTINCDGSGSELLRHRDIVDILANADIDEEHYHYKEEIQDSPQIVAHTIIHPDHRVKPWKYNYSRKTILPKGLTCRDLKSFPAKEIVTKGPKFATTIGRGLQIESNPMTSESRLKQTKNIGPDFWMNPVRFRQLYHYPSIDVNIRDSLAFQFVEYNKKILSQRQQYEDLEIHDDRTDDEKIMANEILKRYEKQILKKAMDHLSSLNQESAGMMGSQMPNTYESNAKDERTENCEKLDKILEKEKLEREKEMEIKSAIKNKIVPNYFTSLYGQDFISTYGTDLKSINNSMNSFTTNQEHVVDGTNTNRYISPECAPNTEVVENPVDTEVEEKRAESVRQSAMTEELPVQSPEHAEHFHAIQPEVKNKQSPKLVVRKKEKKYLYYDSSLFIPSAPVKIPTSADLYLPRYLYAQRPAVEPNIQQALVEDPVRRKVYTTSMIGGSDMSQIHQRQTRGITVFPARVDTGLLREGRSYTFKIKMTNTGPESSYFKVRQPPASSGIRVEFLPGPIPAGLSRRLSVHVYAIAHSLEATESDTFLFEHPLQVTTSTDRLVIPIVGRVMVADKYDSMYLPVKDQLSDQPGAPHALPISGDHE